MIDDPDRIELIALRLQCRVADSCVAQDRSAIRLGDRQQYPDLHIGSSIRTSSPARRSSGEQPAALYAASSVNANTSIVVDRIGQARAEYNRSPVVCAERGQVPTTEWAWGMHGRAVRQGTELGIAAGRRIFAR